MISFSYFVLLEMLGVLEPWANVYYVAIFHIFHLRVLSKHISFVADQVFLKELFNSYLTVFIGTQSFTLVFISFFFFIFYLYFLGSI